MELTSYLQVYLTERDLSAKYQRDLRDSVTNLNRWADSAVAVADLTDDMVNRWLVFLATNMSPVSVRHHRKNLLAIWRAAFEANLTDSEPRRVRRIKVPAKPPEAWALAEMAKLLKAADEMPGEFLRVAMTLAAFLRAYTLVAWDSGLRPSDMVELAWSQISPDGVLVHIQRKTGKLLLCPLKPPTLAALAKIAAPRRDLIFGSIATRDRCYRLFGRLVKRAGLTGSVKKLRKSAATHVEANGQDGDATKFLGHSRTSVTKAHYLDPKHLRPDRPETPPIA